MIKKFDFFFKQPSKWLIIPSFLFYLLNLQAQAEGPCKFRLPHELREVSGLAIGGVDSLWWHNDSGNTANLFLTDAKGQLKSTVNLPKVINRDWEDLTKDTLGHLYIGDFGDNRRSRSELQIYRYHPISEALDSIQFAYPANGRYDVEAFFWHQDSLHLFTKSKIKRARLTTYHFVIPAQAGGLYTAELRDSLQLKKRAVTAAAIHPETGQVVLLAYYYTKRFGFLPYSAANVYYFTDYPKGHFLRGRMKARRISLLVATQYESIDFLSSDRILVASEQTLFIKAKAKKIRWKN